MIFPDKQTYLRDAKEYSVIPVFEEYPADFETPLSVYLKTGGNILLESIERGENVGRYSIIGKGELARLTVRGSGLEISEMDRLPKTETLQDPIAGISKYLESLDTPKYEGLPPFSGGAIGYLGYETVRFFENIPVKPLHGNIPDAIAAFPRATIVYDSVKRTVTAIIATRLRKPSERAAHIPISSDESLPEYDCAASEYDKACAELAEISGLLSRQIAYPNTTIRDSAGNAVKTDKPMDESNRAWFENTVRECKRLISEGEIYQIVLSRSIDIETRASPFDVYKALRALNPSPYLFYLDFGDHALVGSSPEVMLKVTKREAILKPIAGTRPRGTTVAEDEAIAASLLADEKETAEHVMLVDLGRNDLGRVAVPGTVEVTRYMDIEKYSHVMHIVSTVRAELAEGLGPFDAIRATFPAGTLTGAPKIRAMELIDSFEKEARGPYGGMVFYLGYSGELDSCITILTIVFENGKAHVRAGAGIVADSSPEAEYRETCAKAGALIDAISLAEMEG